MGASNVNLTQSYTVPATFEKSCLLHPTWSNSRRVLKWEGTKRDLANHTRPELGSHHRRPTTAKHLQAYAMTATATPKRTDSISRTFLSFNSFVTPPVAIDAVGARPRRTQRRPTKQASYELCNHAKAYLEGAQCTRKHHTL